MFSSYRSAWQIWWKYFHNFRRNVQCRAVSCPPAGLKLRAQIWLFLRIISQCQLSRGRSIKSGCSIYWVSWTKQIKMKKLQTDSDWHCRMSSSHSDVQISQCLQLDRHLQVDKTIRQIEWKFVCRTDSTIVAPYERWQYYNPNVRWDGTDPRGILCWPTFLLEPRSRRGIMLPTRRSKLPGLFLIVERGNPVSQKNKTSELTVSSQ